MVLGVLEIALRRDPVSRQRFGLGQGQIALIVSLRALSVSCLRAGKPRRLVSAARLGSSRRGAGHNFRIRARPRRNVFRFRNVFHVGPYAAPAKSRATCVGGFVVLQHRRWAHCREGSDQTSRVREVEPWHSVGNTEAGRTNPHRLRLHLGTQNGDFKSPAEFRPMPGPMPRVARAKQ